MARFAFRLQVVLDQRERERDQRAQEHGTKTRELAEARQVLASLQADRDAAAGSLDRLVRDWTMNLDEIRQVQFHLPTLDRRLGRQQRVVELAAFAAEQSRLALVEATQAVDVLRQLREKAHQAHLREEDRAEARLFDELATARHLRKQGPLS